MELYKLYKPDHRNFDRNEEYFRNIKDAEDKLRNLIMNRCKKLNKPNKEQIDKMIEENFEDEDIVERLDNIVEFVSNDDNVVRNHRIFYNIWDKSNNKKTVYSEYKIVSVNVKESRFPNINILKGYNDSIFKLCKYNRYNSIEYEDYFEDKEDAIDALNIKVEEERNLYSLPLSDNVLDYVNYNLEYSEIIHNLGTLIGFKPMNKDIQFDYRNFYYLLNKRQQREIKFSQYIVKIINII